MSTQNISKGFIFLMAAVVGVMAANLYYAQPIISFIANSLGIRADAAGLILTMTQVGYGLGVLFVVPLGDLIENRRIIFIMMGVTILAELALGFSSHVVPYFVASLLVGIGASTLQIVVPYVSHLSEPSQRGSVLGTLMSGMMMGIMLSRPLSSLLTDLISFHAVFFVSASLMLLLLWKISSILPERRPVNHGLHYGQLILSMRSLVMKTPTLRRRGFYQACLFGAFCLFWTTVPMMLMESQYHFSQKAVAIFALAGVAGAVVAPLAGKMADRGWSQRLTVLSSVVGVLSFVISFLVQPGSIFSLVMLLIAANLLDAGVASHLVLGQRAIFSIDPKNQGRLNGLYIAMIYVGGASGSALGAWAYAHGGWQSAVLAGFCFPAVGLIVMATEPVFKYKEI